MIYFCYKIYAFLIFFLFKNRTLFDPFMVSFALKLKGFLGMVKGIFFICERIWTDENSTRSWGILSMVL